MAKAKKGGGKGNGPNWTPYLIAFGVACLACAFLSVKEPTSSEANEYRGPKRSIEEMYAQVEQMAVALEGVAGRGETGAFAKIKAMAEEAKKVLKNAEAATTDEEKRKILEEGLAQKRTWAESLTQSSAAIQAEQDAGPDGQASKDFFAGSGDVLHVSEATPSDAQKKKDFFETYPKAMLKFYAPWCGHCKKMAPHFAAVAAKPHIKGKVGFAAVDATQESNKAMAEQYKIKRYPTLVWHSNGYIGEYPTTPKSLTEEELDKWVTKRLQPPFTEVDSVEDIVGALAEAGGGDMARVCIAQGSKKSEEFKGFVIAGEKHRGKLVFAWAPGQEGAETSIQLHRGANAAVPYTNSYKGLSATEGVVTWLEDTLSEKEPGDYFEFDVVFDRSDGAKLGLDIDRKDGVTLHVDKVGEGAVSEWNVANSGKEVLAGDQIVEVNDVRGDAPKLAEQLRDESLLRVKVRRKKGDGSAAPKKTEELD